MHTGSESSRARRERFQTSPSAWALHTVFIPPGTPGLVPLWAYEQSQDPKLSPRPGAHLAPPAPAPVGGLPRPRSSSSSLSSTSRADSPGPSPRAGTPLAIGPGASGSCSPRPSAGASCSATGSSARGSPAPASGSSKPAAVPVGVDLAYSDGTPWSRGEAIRRYREKRGRRAWGRRVIYEGRREAACRRQRVGGRFAGYVKAEPAGEQAGGATPDTPSSAAELERALMVSASGSGPDTAGCTRTAPPHVTTADQCIQS
eukprot:tig00020830_g14497.t1